MNKYLVKIAEFTDDQKAHSLAAASGVGATALVGHHNYHRGNFTGRETFYHGTAESYADKIKKEGIHPRKSPGAIDAVERQNRTSLKSEGLSFTTKSRNTASHYAAQAEHMKIHGVDSLGEAQQKISRGTFRGGKVVELNVPTWKTEFKAVPNPEVRMHIKNMRNASKSPLGRMMNPGSGTKTGRRVLLAAKLQPFKDDHIVRGAIGSEHVVGGVGYKPNSAKEMGQFAMHSPGRILKAVGKTFLAGAATAAAVEGAHRVNKYLKSRQ